MELPAKVRETLESLKRKHRYPVSVALIRGSYYAYEVAKERTKEGVRKSHTLYLGKISEDGTFTEARHRKEETRAKSLEELLKKKKEERKDPLEQLIRPGRVDLGILEAISTDGRISVAEIARKVGISQVAARYRLKKLEKRYGIKYTLEFGYSFFGFFRFIIFIKFKGRKSSPEAIKEVFEKEPTIQYAAMLSGKYDVFVYMLAESPILLERKLYDLRSSPPFASYDTYWYVNYITYSYGYMPMRERFFEILKEKTWHKTEDTPRKKQDQLLEREYLLLKELGEDGRRDFAQIDEKYKFSKGAAQYTYYRLIERKIIYRITITMDKIPLKYIMLAKCNQLNVQEFNAHRDSYFMDVIQETDTPLNKYLLIGDISSPNGLLYITPIFDDGDVEKIKSTITDTVRGSYTTSFIVTETLVGHLGFRRIDNTKSLQYGLIPTYKQGFKTAGNYENM